MKSDFRKLLLLCSDDITRDSMSFPWVDGNYVYATNGRIIGRMPLQNMEGVPVTQERLPNNPAMIYPNRPDAEFESVTGLSLPDREYFPKGWLAAYPFRLGNAIVSPVFINLLYEISGTAEIEINSPGTVVMWRVRNMDLEGCIATIRIKTPSWVWDAITGGFIEVYEHADNGDFSLTPTT